MVELCRRCRNRNQAYLGTTAYLPTGRHRIADPSQIIRLRKAKNTIAQIARISGVSVRRVFQILQTQRRNESRR